MADGVDAGTFVTKLLEMARLDPEYLKDLDKLRRPVVVVFTDIQGSTAYFEEHGDAAGLLMVHNCNRTVREAVEKRGGQIIKSIGDGMLATFTDAAAAVNASINMQTILSEVNDLRPDAQRVGVRIGIHYGIGIVKANDVFGDVVNMASRVESAATAGQIVISDALRKQLDESQFNIRELGRFKLKGKTSEHSLFEVVWNPKAAAPAKPAAQVARFQLQ
jgi:class 3 adenylate cyclase